MESTLKFQRGDIYFVRLDSSTGSEQNGTRPAVILQNDVGNTHSPTLIVATLTSKTEKKAAQPTHCLVEPEKLEPSIVQAEQISAPFLKKEWQHESFDKDHRHHFQGG